MARPGSSGTVLECFSRGKAVGPRHALELHYETFVPAADITSARQKSGFWIVSILQMKATEEGCYSAVFQLYELYESHVEDGGSTVCVVSKDYLY